MSSKKCLQVKWSETASQRDGKGPCVARGGLDDLQRLGDGHGWEPLNPEKSALTRLNLKATLNICNARIAVQEKHG